jgi:ABC-type transporter Mla MlaB component
MVIEPCRWVSTSKLGLLAMALVVGHVTKTAGHEILIAVHGSLDRRIGPTLQRAIDKLTLRGCRRVLLDLRELHEIDAAGTTLHIDFATPLCARC